MTVRSLHLTMRDGVRVAVDVHLPRGGAPAPTILRATRYLRSVAWRGPLDRLGLPWFFDTQRTARKRFVDAGYAWVDVDVRGSGASTGCWTMPWSPELVADLGEVVEWIINQSWSDGGVGALGISYDGTCAELLLVNQHPAVKAVAPRFCLEDTYADVAFPGGLRNAWFIAAWQRLNDSFDADVPADFLPWWVATRLGGGSDAVARSTAVGGAMAAGAGRAVAGLVRAVVRGVRPVSDGVADDEARDNCDLVALAAACECRDDEPPDPRLVGHTIDTFSPHRYADAIDGSGSAVLSYAGWYDGAYADGAIRRHHRLTNPANRLIVGPWNHGGSEDVDPAGAPTKTRHDHDGELLRWFDVHLRGGGPDRSAPVRYFTVGEGWKDAESWPPPTRPWTLWLTAGGALVDRPVAAEAARVFRPDARLSSGHRNRWKGYLGMPADYRDLRRRDEGRVVFDGVPLAEAMEVTGRPEVVLQLATDVADHGVFLWLEEVRADGAVAHVTEGLLRPAHRAGADGQRTFMRADLRPMVPGDMAEVRLLLLPISYRFAAGSRVRLAMGFADVDNFDVMAVPTAVRLGCGGAWLSRLDLPVVLPA